MRFEEVVSCQLSVVSWKKRWCAIAPVALLIVAMSCHSARVTEPLPEKLMGSDPQAQMDFWHAMPERALASNDEAMHAILLFVDNEDAAGNYDARVAMLKRREILSQSFKGPANEAVQRG